MSDTRTVYSRMAPALAAYVAWLDADPTRTFDLAQYDLFAANYCAAPADPPLAQAVDTVRANCRPAHMGPKGLES